MEDLEYFDAVLPTLLVVNWHENMVQLVIFGCKFGENWYFFFFGPKTIGYTDTICCRLIFQRDDTTVNQLPCVSYQQYAM